jgi:ABC-type spermidine/putrescine transport system permease subunit II
MILGCFFAPLIAFFALSGIWQTIGTNSHLLQLISTLHTVYKLKTGENLSSPAFAWLNVAMAGCLLATVVLGVVIALKTPASRLQAFIAILLGMAIPSILIAVHLLF